MPPLHILFIDDHAMFRTGLRAVIQAGIENVEVLEAATVAEALHADIAAPAAILLDLFLTGLSGLEGLPLLKRKWPQAPVIVLSSDAAPETVRAARARGANAFVSKEKTADEIVAVVGQALARTLNGQQSAEALESEPQGSLLTPRQCEVLDLLCQGLPNKAIGLRLALSENTVRGHVQAIFGILKVSTRSEAAFAARRLGLVR